MPGAPHQGVLEVVLLAAEDLLERGPGFRGGAEGVVEHHVLPGRPLDNPAHGRHLVGVEKSGESGVRGKNRLECSGQAHEFVRHHATRGRGRNQAGNRVERRTGKAQVLLVFRIGLVAVRGQPEAPVELVLESAQPLRWGGHVDQNHLNRNPGSERPPPVHQAHPVLPLDLLQGPCGRRVHDPGDAVVEQHSPGPERLRRRRIEQRSHQDGALHRLAVRPACQQALQDSADAADLLDRLVGYVGDDRHRGPLT